MSLKSFSAKIFAASVQKQLKKWANNPIETQQKVFESLITKAVSTQFGKDHDFISINNHEDFVNRVPVRDYEQLKPYVDKVVQGESDILWPGKPAYFAKTSGTTSGVKYIPITEESMAFQVQSSRNAILCYIHETGNASVVNGKWIFLQGSPKMSEKNGIKVGRLSGISAHYVPNYLQKNRLPSWETNCIEDWETKVEAIIEETIHENMTLIAGIPSWVQMYFERIENKTNKKISEVFKNFNLYIYGGVNYEPYRNKFEELIGKRVDSIELFPASEGFFAFQDSQKEKGMLLQLNSGIFYEFIKADEFYNENPKRLTLKDVELGVNYVLIISTNAGLWAYNIGDTVQFTCLKPYRIIVSGRIKHFISAFGEHVIASEVEQALQEAIKETEIVINEFTVAPQVNPNAKELPYHEWFIEFDNTPEELDKLASKIDAFMQQQNSYYADLITGKILQTLKITPIQKGGFKAYMESIGKLGGQNKVQRLANDRKLADALFSYKKA